MNDTENIMDVLLTGNNGYIGSMLTRLLLEKGYRVTGLDTNYYLGCEFDEFNYPQMKQISKELSIWSRTERLFGMKIQWALLLMWLTSQKI